MIEERKMNLSNSGNVGIISLMASLESNSKEIAKELNRDVQKITDNVKDIDLKLGTENVQKQLEQIKKLIDEELQGLDTSKYFQSIVEVFSDSTKSTEDYLEILKSVRQELEWIAGGTVNRKGDINILGDLSPASFQKVLSYYQKINDLNAKLRQDRETAKGEAGKIDGRTIRGIKQSYNSNADYTSSFSTESLISRARDIGILGKLNDPSLGPILTEYNQLLSVFDLLNKKKNELLEGKQTKASAKELVKTTKELQNVFSEIKLKEGQLKSVYGAENLLSSTLEGTNNLPQQVGKAVGVYIDAVTQGTQREILNAEQKLGKYFESASTRARDQINKEYDKAQTKNQKYQEKVQAKQEQLAEVKNAKVTTSEIIDDQDVSNIGKYLVSLDDCVSNISKIQSKLSDIDDDGEWFFEDLEPENQKKYNDLLAERVKYYARIKNLGKTDDEIDELFKSSNIDLFSGQLNEELTNPFIDKEVDEATQKQIQNILDYGKVVEVATESVKEFNQTSQQLQEAPGELIEEPSDQLAAFDKLEEQQQELRQEVERTNDIIDEQISLMESLDSLSSSESSPAIFDRNERVEAVIDANPLDIPSLLQGEQQQMQDSVAAENEDLDKLRAAIELVKKAIEDKTKAITEEEAQMASSVQNEIAELNKLVDKLNSIQTLLKSEDFSSIQSIKLPLGPEIKVDEWTAEIDKALEQIGRKTIPLDAEVKLEQSKGEDKKKQADAVSDAYDRLIKTEEQYQKLVNKKNKKNITLSEVSDLESLTIARERDLEIIDNATDLTDKQKKKQEQYNQAVDDATRVVEAYNAALAKTEWSKYADKMDQQLLTLDANSNGKTSDYATKLKEIQLLVDQLRSKLPIDVLDDNTKNELNDLKSQISSAMTEIKSSVYKEANATLLSNTKSDWAKWTNANTKALKKYKNEIDEINKALDNVSNQAELDAIKQRISEIKRQVVTTGKAGVTWVEQWKKRLGSLLTYLASFGSFYEIVGLFKQGFSIIKDLDDALTEMRKVSDDSLKTLKEYQRESFDLANNVGTTSQALQKSTADWMRLGEAMEQAKESAQTTTKLLNVSEFGDIDEATDAMVAMSQAYKELDKNEIVDVLNNIGNNFAIATDELATGLQKSAAALKIAGNDMYEASALITAGNAIVQDADMVGAGVRTIALRLQGTEVAREQLEEWGEDVSDYIIQTKSKIDEQIRAFTSVASNDFKGFSILDPNGNLKDTYDIMLGIAEIYDEIVASDKANGTNKMQGLLEVIAGKNRSNIAASIIQNKELLESVYESAQNSAGSADEELAKYLDSITGKIAKFQNQLQELAAVTFDSELVKDFIDAGTELLSILTNIVDTIGVLGLGGVAGAGAGIGLFIKNLDYPELRGIKIA